MVLNNISTVEATEHLPTLEYFLTWALASVTLLQIKVASNKCFAKKKEKHSKLVEILVIGGGYGNYAYRVYVDRVPQSIIKPFPASFLGIYNLSISDLGRNAP